jgi:FlaA1/EpsC-like NDP-sugar epimerase
MTEKPVFNDKSILITGGTGSFGKAFVKTARQEPWGMWNT